MIEKRHVDHYASASGVDSEVAEKDVILTYILKTMRDDGKLDMLAFKGGTCIRKNYLGKVGRFSEDLDFTLIQGSPYELEEDLKEYFNDKHTFGIKLSGYDWRHIHESSLACKIQYKLPWRTAEVKFEISLREKPVLKLVDNVVSDDLYFKFTEFSPFSIPCLKIEEILSEKIRATYQRSTTRDLYDLYQFAVKAYDKNLVRRIIPIKFWNDKSEFDPHKLHKKIEDTSIDFSQVSYLIKGKKHPKEEDIKKQILDNYAYLQDLDSASIEILGDVRKHNKFGLVEELKKELFASS